MSDNSVYSDDDQDQDAEPTMMAAPEDRPDGTGQPVEAHAQDADDQMGAEEPTD